MTAGEGSDPLRRYPYAVPAAQRRSLDRLTDAERHSIEFYAHGGYERVNKALRGELEMTPQIEAEVATIRSGLRKYPLDTDIRVTREVSGYVFGIDDPNTEAVVDGLILQEFIEDGFMSTTMAATPAHSSRHARPVTLDLLVFAGTPALAVADLGGFPLEHELLIIDARHYTIVGARYDQDLKRWRLFGLVEGGP